MDTNKIYILPNIITTFGLLSGFLSVLFAINANYTAAVYLIILAMILDGLDGPVARITKTETEFGKEFDSLADMVSFGVSPSLVLYIWGFNSFSYIGVIFSFIYVAAVAVRLAKFNSETQEKGFFRGIPSPAGAATLMSIIWFSEYYSLSGTFMYVFSSLFTLLVSYLMISNVPFFNLKSMDVARYKNTNNLIIAIVVFASFCVAPALVFMLIFISYICYSTFLYYDLDAFKKLLIKYTK